MAKTIDEICQDLTEWADENPERSVFLIAGNENKDVLTKTQGVQHEIITCVASSIADSAKTQETITIALEFANEVKLQEEEDNRGLSTAYPRHVCSGNDKSRSECLVRTGGRTLRGDRILRIKKEAFASPSHATAAVGTIRADVMLRNERVVGHPVAALNGKRKTEICE